MSDDIEETLPGFSFAKPATPEDSMRLIAAGGAEVARRAQLTGADKFEHMVRYCLKLMAQASQKNSICAFYVSDFDDCDEATLQVIQKLIAGAGYITKDFRPEPLLAYQGFWAWRKK